ncbi:hypothetical protein OAU50_08465, partial [Planctomycetota bacterium]|nr:hypothetical protein [Planctomycetota bacterium]
ARVETGDERYTTKGMGFGLDITFGGNDGNTTMMEVVVSAWRLEVDEEEEWMSVLGQFLILACQQTDWTGLAERLPGLIADDD